MKVSVSSGDEEKNRTAELAETAEFFPQKGQSTNHCADISSPLRPTVSLQFVVLFSFGESISLFPWVLGDENKRMKKEEAENAEFLF